MTEHTPGPWHVESRDDGDCYAIAQVEGPDSYISVCAMGVGPPQGEEEARARADARLIAASPDLLAAAEADLRFHEHFSTCLPGHGGDTCDTCEELAVEAGTLRKAAIAKATEASA